MVSGYRALGACTESLGSESGDVGGDEIDHLPAVLCAGPDEDVAGDAVVPQTCPGKRQRTTERRLPPPMPRAADAFMRAERRGGRLILTEVVRPAERPRGVFRASRADGRLLLRFAEQEEEEPCSYGVEASAAPAPASPEPAEPENGVVVGGCCNGVGFSQVAPGTGRRVEIGAVMGI
nr:protein SUGARY ENHANCER 1-like [Lolium perenne]